MPPREIFHSAVVFGSIGVRVKMAWPGVAHILKELHEPERGLDVRRPESEILV